MHVVAAGKLRKGQRAMVPVTMLMTGVVVMLVMALAHIWQSVKVAIAMAGIHLLVPLLARRYACTTPKSYLISMLPNSGDFEASQVRRGALSLLFFVELRCADKTR